MSSASSNGDDDNDSSTSTPLTSLAPSRSHSPLPLKPFAHDPTLPFPSHLSADLPPTTSFDDDPSYIPHPEDPHSLRHAEFGHCEDQRYRATSVWTRGSSLAPVEGSPSAFTWLATYYSYLFLIVIGHVRDFFGKLFFRKHYEHLRAHDVSCSRCGLSGEGAS